MSRKKGHHIMMDGQNAGADEKDQKSPEDEQMHETRCNITCYDASPQKSVQQHFFKRIGFKKKPHGTGSSSATPEYGGPTLTEKELWQLQPAHKRATHDRSAKT